MRLGMYLPPSPSVLLLLAILGSLTFTVNGKSTVIDPCPWKKGILHKVQSKTMQHSFKNKLTISFQPWKSFADFILFCASIVKYLKNLNLHWWYLCLRKVNETYSKGNKRRLYPLFKGMQAGQRSCLSIDRWELIMCPKHIMSFYQVVFIRDVLEIRKTNFPCRHNSNENNFFIKIFNMW